MISLTEFKMRMVGPAWCVNGEFRSTDISLVDGVPRPELSSSLPAKRMWEFALDELPSPLLFFLPKKFLKGPMTSLLVLRMADVFVF
ncbi:hypothetical protein EF849_21695 [Aeromonas jandaei]|nr:hypothetical protein [Aeromonas jandaei]